MIVIFSTNEPLRPELLRSLYTWWYAPCRTRTEVTIYLYVS